MEALCVIGGQYMAFSISEMKYSEKANLSWPPRAEIFKPIDFSYEDCLFFFVYKEITELICYAHVTQRTSSKLSLMLIFPGYSPFCIQAHEYIHGYILQIKSLL